MSRLARAFERSLATARLEHARLSPVWVGEASLFRRVGWDEALEISAASVVHTIDQPGPDRVIGFSPIPAISQISYAAGSRFLTLLGGGRYGVVGYGLAGQRHPGERRRRPRALVPFTRLVHVISLPLGYLVRPWQIVLRTRPRSVSSPQPSP